MLKMFTQSSTRETLVRLLFFFWRIWLWLIVWRGGWLCCRQLCPRAAVWRWWCHSRALTTSLATSELSGKQVDSGWPGAGRHECSLSHTLSLCVCVGVCFLSSPATFHTSVCIKMSFSVCARIGYAKYAKELLQADMQHSPSVQKTQVQELLQEYFILWHASAKE